MLAVVAAVELSLLRHQQAGLEAAAQAAELVLSKAQQEHKTRAAAQVELNTLGLEV